MSGARCSWLRCWAGWRWCCCWCRPGPTPASWTRTRGPPTWWPGSTATTWSLTSSTGAAQTVSQCSDKCGDGGDIYCSPRDKYRPQFPIQFMEFLKSSAGDEAVILWDEQLEWRDPASGATLLHIACWTGNINLFRSFCNDLSVSRNMINIITIIINAILGQKIVGSVHHNWSHTPNVCNHKWTDKHCGGIFVKQEF